MSTRINYKQFLKNAALTLCCITLLAGCAARPYVDGGGRVTEVKNGFYAIVAEGHANTDQKTAYEILMIRIADFCLENDYPFFKLGPVKMERLSHYSQYTSAYGLSGPKHYQGESFRLRGRFFPFSGTAPANSPPKTYVVEEIYEKYKHRKIDPGF